MAGSYGTTRQRMRTLPDPVQVSVSSSLRATFGRSSNRGTPEPAMSGNVLVGEERRDVMVVVLVPSIDRDEVAHREEPAGNSRHVGSVGRASATGQDPGPPPCLLYTSD